MKLLKSGKIEHPFLLGMSSRHLEIAVNNAKQVEIAEGEILFRENEPANRLFLVQSGKVALETRYAGEDKLLQTIGAGEVLGWSWLFPPFIWHFQARALKPTRAIVLDGSQLLVSCEEDPKFGYDLMRRVTQIVVDRLQVSRNKFIKSTHVPAV